MVVMLHEARMGKWGRYEENQSKWRRENTEEAARFKIDYCTTNTSFTSSSINDVLPSHLQSTRVQSCSREPVCSAMLYLPSLS